MRSPKTRAVYAVLASLVGLVGALVCPAAAPSASTKNRKVLGRRIDLSRFEGG
jgi:hypothetical protein